MTRNEITDGPTTAGQPSAREGNEWEPLEEGLRKYYAMVIARRIGQLDDRARLRVLGLLGELERAQAGEVRGPDGPMELVGDGK